MEDEAALLVSRYRGGDQRAAEELYVRFERQLVHVARQRMSAQLARRLDPEDVVQSVFRSFFGAVRDGRFAVEHDGGLWRLLSMITVNKVRQKVEFHQADKRALCREESAGDDSESPDAIVALAREPSPLDAVVLIEEVEGLMAGLEDVQRTMLEMRLAGYQIEEIAEKVGRSERTVRRLMDKIRNRLVGRLEESVLVTEPC